MEEFNEPFDIGVGVHACGSLTDAIQLKCFQWQAAFLLCPCCVGKVKAPHYQGQDADVIRYPRSETVGNILSKNAYFELASAGDYGEWDFTSDVARSRRACKSLVERDRCLSAEEKGYRTFLSKMIPQTCTPKNDIVFGFPVKLSQAKSDHSSAEFLKVIADVVDGSDFFGSGCPHESTPLSLPLASNS